MYNEVQSTGSERKTIRTCSTSKCVTANLVGTLSLAILSATTLLLCRSGAQYWHVQCLLDGCPLHGCALQDCTFNHDFSLNGEQDTLYHMALPHTSAIMHCFCLLPQMQTGMRIHKSHTVAAQKSMQDLAQEQLPVHSCSADLTSCRP